MPVTAFSPPSLVQPNVQMALKKPTACRAPVRWPAAPLTPVLPARRTTVGVVTTTSLKGTRSTPEGIVMSLVCSHWKLIVGV